MINSPGRVDGGYICVVSPGTQHSAAYDTISFKSTLIPKVQVHGFQKYINFKCTYKLKFSAEKLAISILEVNRRFVISSKMSVGANEVL